MLVKLRGLNDVLSPELTIQIIVKYNSFVKIPTRATNKQEAEGRRGGRTSAESANYDARVANKSFFDTTFETYDTATWWCYHPNKPPSPYFSVKFWSINSRASQTDREQNLNCPKIRESIRKCLSKSRRKRSTIRQGPLIQPRCSLASINWEAFEVVGTWGRVSKLLKNVDTRRKWMQVYQCTANNAGKIHHWCSYGWYKKVPGKTKK